MVGDTAAVVISVACIVEEIVPMMGVVIIVEYDVDVSSCVVVDADGSKSDDTDGVDENSCFVDDVDDGIV